MSMRTRTSFIAVGPTTDLAQEINSTIVEYEQEGWIVKTITSTPQANICNPYTAGILIVFEKNTESDIPTRNEVSDV